MASIGNKIKKMRELKNYTQEYMAQRLSLSKTAYGNIERDETDITMSRLEEIANILDTSPHQILAFDESAFFVNNKINNAYGVYQAKHSHHTTNDRYVEHLEKEVEYLRAENTKLLQIIAHAKYAKEEVIR